MKNEIENEVNQILNFLQRLFAKCQNMRDYEKVYEILTDLKNFMKKHANLPQYTFYKNFVSLCEYEIQVRDCDEN